MNSAVKARVWLFATATAAVVITIVFASLSVWKHFTALRSTVRDVGRSINIANKFQESFLGLNSHLLRFQIDGNPAAWAQFKSEAEDLNHWIDLERPKLESEEEKHVLDEIDRSYDNYLSAADKVHDAPRNGSARPLEAFARFEQQGKIMIELGYRLAAAHQNSQERFMLEANRALRHLGALLVCALILLVTFASGLWIVLYRDTIAPLHAKLIESRALLERQEKLASLGVLAAGLAHEIRNPLTAMKARLFTLMKRLDPGTVQIEDATVISREIDRLERILKDFLQFARPSDPSFTRIDALQPIREVQSLLGPQLEQNHIRLVVEDGVQAKIKVDSQQITQVLINLVKNAADSIGRGGTVTLRVRRDSLVLSGRATEAAVLEVVDTGKGIAPDVEKRLFDPFHTTKEGGTGLGLSIAGRIVERHGGALRYKTRLGQGTTFGVVLPEAKDDEPTS